MVSRMEQQELNALGERSNSKNRLTKQRASMEYLRKHYDQLVREFPNQWVIISGGRLVGTESNADRFVERIGRSKGGNRVLYYLASPKKRMLL